MRLKIATLRRVVKGDLTIQFVPQALTSYGGLELLGRYLHRIDLGARLRQAFTGLRSDYGSHRIALVLLALFYVGARRLEHLRYLCQRSPHSEPPGSGKQSHPGSPIWSQAGSPMLSHPGAGIMSHPAGRDRISFAYPQPPCVAVGNTFVAGGDAHGWTEESGDRHSRVASPSAVGRA